MEEVRAVSRTSESPSFEDYVAARGRALWRIAWLLTGDPHRAEDLVQIALLASWRRWDRVCRDGAIDGYVRRALVTAYIDGRRRRWRGETPTAELPEQGRPDPSAAERADVLAALARLPRQQRAVVVLRFYDDLTEAQTATALGVSVGTVKSHTSRALAALRVSPLLEEQS